MDAIRSRGPEGALGGTRTVYLALCELAARSRDGHHGGFAARDVDVAAVAGVSSKTVQRVRPMLVAAGVLSYDRPRDPQTGQLLTGEWVLRSPVDTVSTGPVDISRAPVSSLTRAGETAVKKEELLNEERARASAQLFDQPSASLQTTPVTSRPRFNGKPVKADEWALTVRVLEEFNAQAGRRLGALDGMGQPSESAKRIYSRVCAFPSLTLEEHAAIIARTLASKWWGEGPPSVGVVYGPKVFEENIERPGVAPVADNGRRSGRSSRSSDDEWLERLAAVGEEYDRRREGL